MNVDSLNIQPHKWDSYLTEPNNMACTCV